VVRLGVLYELLAGRGAPKTESQTSIPVPA
jgi:hypothetical protein